MISLNSLRAGDRYTGDGCVGIMFMRNNYCRPPKKVYKERIFKLKSS